MVDAQHRILADRQLVDRCLTGDALGWEELYSRCHGRMVAAIQSLFGSTRPDPNLVDEIVARAWYTIVADDGRVLGQFDVARRCRLTTFLVSITKREAARYLRSERRRWRREAMASRMGPAYADEADSEDRIRTEVAEFLEILTPREREFCRSQMLGQGAPIEPGLSRVNVWQLRCRIRRKLGLFTAPK